MSEPKRLRVPNARGLKDVRKPIVSVAHGYLWIGGEEGPCLLWISGKKTLLKIAAMLKAHAR